MSTIRFRPPWWGVALALAGCAAGIALGNWQSGRAREKLAAAESVRVLELRGEFVAKFTVLLDNKLYRGRAGYQVVQPLHLADSTRHVLVNRGWIAAPERRDTLPEVQTPAGIVHIGGVRLERFARAFEPAGTERAGPVWQNVGTEEFAHWSDLEIERLYVLEQWSPLNDGLVRDWPRTDDRVTMHQSYALQWYSLAALSIILLFALNFKREKQNS